MSLKSKIIFLSWFALMLLLGVFFSSDRKELAFVDLKISVASQDELYFKNIRSFYYSKRKSNSESIDQFNLNGLHENHLLNPTICNSWKTGEALILFQNAANATIRVQSEHSEITIDCTNMDGNDHLKLAFLLHLALEKSHAVYMDLNGEKTRLNTADLKKIQVVLKDYFKLIGALR